MKSPTKLTDPQLILLSAAAQRDDHRVMLSERQRGGAADKLLAALTAKRLIEPTAKAGKRSRAPGADIAGATNYRISAAGLARIQTPMIQVEEPRVSAAKDSFRPPRAGSKLGQLVALLSSAAGATIDDLIRKTGWLPHTARAALTDLRHRGYDERLERSGAKRISVYRIAAGCSIAS